MNDADTILSNFDIIESASGQPQVILGGEIDVPLTLAARSLHTHISLGSIPSYLRAGAALFGAVDAVRRRSGSTTTAWSEPRLAKLLWRETLEAMGCSLKYSDEKKYYLVTPPAGRDSVVRKGLSAAMHLYSCAVEREVAALNPLKIREPMFRGDPVSLFRLPMTVGSVRTTKQPPDVNAVLACLRGNVPVNVEMMFELMAEGLARIMEQATLTVWDWAQHDFGPLIATPDKWDNYQRTKEQHVTPILLGRMLHWFDHQRIDPKGRTRAVYERLRRSRVGQDEMMSTPLFPNNRGGFYTYSGIVDVWFKPALTAELRGTVTHGIRIAGVNAFIAWVNADESLSEEQKQAEKAKFAAAMGWRWADKMLAYYGAPENRNEVAQLMGRWAHHRHENLKRLAESPEELIAKRSAPTTKEGSVKSSNFERLMRLSARA